MDKFKALRIIKKRKENDLKKEKGLIDFLLKKAIPQIKYLKINQEFI